MRKRNDSGFTPLQTLRTYRFGVSYSKRASGLKFVTGFSIFELLIVMAFMAIMGSIGIGYYFNFQRQATLSSTIEEVNAFIYATQQKSIGQQETSQWGVHFENPTGSGKPFYASFKGASYVTPIETRYLDGALDFVYPADGASVDVIFSKITGKVSDGAYKKVYIVLNPGTAMKAVNISPLGVITMNDGEVGWWKMDEGSGTTTGDSSGYGNGITLTGATWGIVGNCKAGQCLSFVGSGDGATLNYNSIFNTRGAITLSAWIKRTTAFNQSTDVFILSRPPAWYFYDSYGSGDIRGEVFIDGVRRGARTTSLPFDGNWYHIVYTYDSNDRFSKIYKNGAVSSSTQLTGLSNYLIDSSAANFISIGNNSLGRGIMFDDLRIYDHALSSDEVKHLYETTK